MNILSAEFIKSCDRPEQFPQERLPEIAFVGRSNVGKSSLINSLLYRRGLAKVSRTPGKTRLVNFYLVTTGDPSLKRLYVVDLPGYGYAKVAKSVRAQWGPMIERYLTGRDELRGVVLLVEARRVAEHDQATMRWLRAIGRPAIVVATKVDKLKNSERRNSREMLREALELSERDEPIPYSSVTHEGREALWKAIRMMLLAPSTGRAASPYPIA